MTVEVGVEIGYRTRAPAGSDSDRRRRAIGSPPSGLAASTMPFDSIPISFAGLRFATIDDRASDELIGRIRLGDAGDDRPLLGADVHLQLDQLLRLRHRLGLEHLRHSQLDLHEVVDRDA